MPQNALRRSRRTLRLPRRPRTVTHPRPRAIDETRGFRPPALRTPTGARFSSTRAQTRGDRGRRKGADVERRRLGRRRQAAGRAREESRAAFARSLSLSLSLSLARALSLSPSLSSSSVSSSSGRQVGGLGPRFARSNVATRPAPGF